MHDSLLMQNISSGINSICKKNGIKKVIFLEVAVNQKSPINESNLLEHLIDMNRGLVDYSTKAKIIFENLPEEIAEIMKIEGEK